MYLISLYFDDKTENQIQAHISDVAKQCGNTFMIDNDVPPHITISAFETLHEKNIVKVLERAILNIKRNKIEWVTVGIFPAVIFIQPVLNEYLHAASSVIHESIIEVPDTIVSKCYKPFSWVPHTTIAKQLSENEMRIAFSILQKDFKAFEGEIVRIELAKKKPYHVIASWELD